MTRDIVCSTLADAIRFAALSVAPYLRSVARNISAFDTKVDHHDPVTVHDRHVEQVVRHTLSRCVPASRAFGEEHGEVTLPSDVEPLSDTDYQQSATLLGKPVDLSAIADLGGRVRWIIDPIDGTANFAAGGTYFGTSIAAELDGQIVAGIVTIPMMREYIFADNCAAYHAFEGETPTQIFADGPHEEAQATLVAYYPPLRLLRTAPDVAAERERSLHEAFMAPRRTGACALDLAYVAAGWTGAMIGTRFKPWDVAAGLHIVRTAGGFVLNLPLETDLPDGYAPGVVAAGANLIPHTAVDVLKAHQSALDATS